MSWTTDQRHAISKIESWVRSGACDRRPFHLDGYAGTGKTTIANSDDIRALLGRTAYLAPTHKAAHVLSTKGASTVMTIYSALYGRPTTTWNCRKCHLQGYDNPPVDADPPHQIEHDILFHDGHLRSWIGPVGRHPGHPLWDYDSIVVDECSMIPSRILISLLALPLRVVLMGDSFQLGPIGADKAWTDGHTPDAQLTEVTRTALDAPHLAAATAVRVATLPTLPRSHPLRRPPAGDTPWQDHMYICATNAERQKINLRRRAQIFGYIPTDLPRKGEPVVARSNYPHVGLFNGAPTLTLEADAQPVDATTLQVKIGGSWHLAHTNGFTDPNSLKIWRDSGSRGASDENLRLQYAYAITGHSSQGSEWPRVTVVGSWSPRASTLERAKWFYTACTRAQHSLHITGN